MADSTYVYIDGESHFVRSENAWRKLRGQEVGLGSLRLIGEPDDRLVLVDSKAKVFWTRKMNPGADRAYYFTSAVGDEPTLHKIKVTLRNFDLEPVVLSEHKRLAKQRQNVLKTQCLIEKPKGVDIALAVRMLEDAHRNAFNVCHLYTSDIDFLPVVEAVRALGKQVRVCGYKDGLSERSPFLHSCDQFVDLEVMLRDQCEMDPSR